MAKTIKCMVCGKATPAHLIDAKPDPVKYPTLADQARAVDEGADFDFLACEPCYGPGWLPL